MRELCLSSELYPVSPADIAALADTPADLQQHVKDEITVLIGDSQSGQTDTLLSGRDAVRRALAENASSVPVRFAFFSKIGRFDFITVFVKPLRARYKIFSSNIYHIAPLEIRKLKIERNIRTKENAYVFSNPLFYYDEAERMLHWDFTGVPMQPDQPYDCHGAYSGSALVEDGVMYVYYTGNVKLPGDFDYVTQGREANTVLVESRDGRTFGDKKLLLTNRDYPADYTLHIRDPKVFALEDRYYMVLGGRKKNDCGAVLLYESCDLENWRFCRELTVPMKFGYMWECPDLFCTEGKWFLSLSPQGLPRDEQEFQNVYTAGYFQVNGDFREGCRLEDFREWDKGFDFYAPQTFTDESGRTLLIAWAGLPDVEEEYVNPTIESGWQHALTVPRVIREQNGRLLQYPVPELEALRGERQLPDKYPSSPDCYG